MKVSAKKIFLFFSVLCFSFGGCAEATPPSSNTGEPSSEQQSDKTVTISFSDCGYTSEKQYKQGEKIEPPEPKRIAGFTFIGWTKDGEIFDFEQSNTAETDALFKASYIASDKITLYDGSSEINLLSGYGGGARVTEKSYDGQFSYKFTTSERSDLYASYTIAYDVIPVGYYEYYVYLDGESFRTASGTPIEAPNYNAVTTGWDILYAAVFDTGIGRTYEGDYGTTVYTHIYTDFSYNKWVRVLVEVTKPLNKKISLRTSPVKAVLTGEMLWSAVPFVYDVYYDEAQIPQGIATHELDKAVEISRTIESFLKVPSTFATYKKNYENIKKQISTLSNKQKEYVFNLEQFERIEV